LKWLYPGIGIKRWMLLSAFGALLLIIGSSGLQSRQFFVIRILDLLILFLGIVILIMGIKRLTQAFIAAVIPATRENELVDILYQRKQLARGPKVVTVGGGTGLSTLLTGLKEYTSNITAIVTVADDGGSSGRIRQQFDILPPGDIRNCLVALADASTMMRDLFQFRFEEGSELAGHSFGNLFITVMTRLTGRFRKGNPRDKQGSGTARPGYTLDTEQRLSLSLHILTGRLPLANRTYPGQINRYRRCGFGLKALRQHPRRCALYARQTLSCLGLVRFIQALSLTY